MKIDIKNLTLTYNDRPAVSQINLSIAKGEMLAIVGPNGAGKSTLLQALAGLKPIKQGSIKGLDTHEIAYLPQQAHIDRSFPLTVFELISMGLYSRIGWHQSIGRSQQKQCLAALAAVGLQGFEKRMISALSGGQMQRALFARVLMQDRPVILLDEPFNAIDEQTITDLTKLLASWHKAKRTIIMALHDLDYVHRHCPITLLLARKCIEFGKTQTVLTHKNIQKAQKMTEVFNESLAWSHS